MKWALNMMWAGVWTEGLEANTRLQQSLKHQVDLLKYLNCQIIQSSQVYLNSAIT